MFHNFGYEVTDIIKEAEEIRYNLKHPYVGTEHLLLSILKNDKKVSKICESFDLTYQRFLDELIKTVGKAKSTLEINLYTPMLKKVLESALNFAMESNDGKVTPSHLVLAMLEEGDGVSVRIMMSLKIPMDALYDKLKVEVKKKKKNLEIMKIGINLTNKCFKLNPLIKRDDELELIIETLLRKQKNNPLLIGKAGVGKTAIVEELSRRIKKGLVPEELRNVEIYELEMGSLVAGTKYRGEFEERLTKIINEIIKEKNIIIFIDEIHSMVNAGGAEGAICASDILKPYLARGELKIIGSTTLEEYHEYIAKDKALDRRFETILINEPNEKDMKSILLNIRKEYENHYQIKITDENIDDLIMLANKYIFNKNNPDKTIDLLDSVCSKIKFRETNNNKESESLDTIIKKKENLLKVGDYQDALKIAIEEQKMIEDNNIMNNYIMTKEDIIKTIESKTKIDISTSMKSKLEKLQNNLTTNILGQEEAIKKLLNTLEYADNKSLSFLLCGGSGVGKTETVKIFSDTYKTNLVRIDMSEYHLEESINKLLGSPQGYVGYNDSYVFQEILKNPYSTILFDEIEKAHPKVLNLLLQILDEGFITDSKGNKIRFDHCYIFLTSNINVGKKIGFSNAVSNNLDNNFSKELVGRIDSIIPYQNITREVALKYIENNLQNKNIDTEILLNESEYEKYGIRNLKNIIKRQNKKLISNF